MTNGTRGRMNENEYYYENVEGLALLGKETPPFSYSYIDGPVTAGQDEIPIKDLVNREFPKFDFDKT